MKRNKVTKEEREKTALETRVSKLSTPDLVKWADQALFGIGRNLTDWGRDPVYHYIDEAQLGANALLVVMNELCSRAENSRNF